MKIKDDNKTRFYIETMTEEYVTSYDDVTQILIKGLSNRKVGATSMNSKSSHSHVVLTCVIESWCKETSAKSFSSSKTSSLTLGHLVSILAEDIRPEDKVYRDFYLTHLLLDSLGGNAKLSVICNISPNDGYVGRHHCCLVDSLVLLTLLLLLHC